MFFAKNSLPGDGLVQQHGHDAADDGANHGNRSVAPVGAALTLDGQNGVGDAGADVTGRVQGVTGQAAERHADGGDDAEHQEVALRAVQAADLRHTLDGEDQNEGSHGFTEDVAGHIGNGRTGGEHAQLGAGLFGCVELILEHQVHDDGVRMQLLHR